MLLCINICELVLLLLCSFYFNFNTMSIGASKTESIRLRREESCVQNFGNEERYSMLVPTRSRIECATECAGNGLCQYFRLRRDDACSLTCEIVLSHNHQNVSSSHSQWQHQNATVNSSRHMPGLLCYEVLPSCSEDSCLLPSCYKDHDPDLYEGNWEKFIDTDDPETQTISYLSEHASQVNVKEAKLIFLDDSGMYNVINAFHSFKNNVSVATFAYAMEKDDYQGFKDSASRVFYSCTANGTLNKAFIHPNGSSWLTTASLAHARMFYQNKRQHHTESGHDMGTIVALLEQGYRIIDRSHVSIERDGLAFSQFSINTRIQLYNSRVPVSIIMPLRFWQHIHVRPGGYYRLRNYVGRVSNKRSEWVASSSLYVKVETLWRPVNVKDCMTHVALVDTVSRLLFQGHRFRVGYERKYLDVADIFVRGCNDVYFILPQQVILAVAGEFADVHVGLRSVVSIRGYNSWCSHPLEGEQVLNNGSRHGLKVQPFVDQKAWTAVFSVYSDGTVDFGSAEDVADAVLAGKDVNILIKWLMGDKVRMLSIDLMTVKDYGLPSVLVAGESKVTWHLANDEGLNLTINSRCDMEKVLVKTNGQCQVLVYNIHSRQPVVDITEVRTVWFIY